MNNEQTMINRTLHEFISLYTECPLDVIKETAKFMSAIIRRSDYVIFQSNFGYCDNDVPFTCIVNRSDSTENGERNIFDIQFWNVDWTSFEIENPPASDMIASEWKLTRPQDIPEWQTLSAKSIVNHENFTDRRMFAEDYIIQSFHLETKLCDILERYYDSSNPFGINPKTSGLVAVIYREASKSTEALLAELGELECRECLYNNECSDYGLGCVASEYGKSSDAKDKE